MKIRLICRYSYQITEDSWNAAYKTVDIPVPKEIEQNKEFYELLKRSIIGAEVIMDE